MRPFGWRKDRIHLNKREAAHIRREVPRIWPGSCADARTGMERARRTHGDRRGMASGNDPEHVLASAHLRAGDISG